MNDRSQSGQLYSHYTTQIDRTSLDAHITRTFSLFLCLIHIRCLNETRERRKVSATANFFLCKEEMHMNLYMSICTRAIEDQE